MTIIRPCGHSADTLCRSYYKDPFKCVYCIAGHDQQIAIRLDKKTAPLVKYAAGRVRDRKGHFVKEIPTH